MRTTLTEPSRKSLVYTLAVAAVIWSPPASSPNLGEEAGK